MKLKHYLLILLNITIGLLNAQSLSWYENIGTRSPLHMAMENHISIVKIEADSQFVYVLGTCHRYPIQFQQNKIEMKENGDAGRGDAFIAQFTHNGHLNWVQKLGMDAISGSYRKHIMSIHKGNIYVSGAFYNTSLIGNDTIRKNGSSFYLAKIDPNGRKIWHKTASGDYFFGDYKAHKIAFDPQDHIYLAGTLDDWGPSLNFDGLSTAKNSKQFIYKFNALGKALSVHSFNEPRLFSPGLNIVDFQLDKDNNLLLLMSKENIGTNAVCASTLALTCLYRVSPQGKMDTLVTLRNKTMVVGSSLSIAENGDIYIAGRYTKIIDINGFQSAISNCDTITGFLARVAPNGHLIWLKTGNSTQASDFFKVIPEKDGNLLMFGIQDYEKNKSNNRFRHAGYLYPYANGETRCFIKRLNPFGVTIDSVEFYADFSISKNRPMMDFTQSPQGNLFFGIDYRCKLDTFSHTLCNEWSRNPLDSIEVQGTKVFVAQLSPSMLQKRQLSLPSVENRYQIFPNPASDVLYVQSNTTFPTQTMAMLYDVNGRLIQQITHDDKKLFMEINVAHQPSGIYILVLRSNGTFISATKIIKL